MSPLLLLRCDAAAAPHAVSCCGINYETGKHKQRGEKERASTERKKKKKKSSRHDIKTEHPFRGEGRMAQMQMNF